MMGLVEEAYIQFMFISHVGVCRAFTDELQDSMIRSVMWESVVYKEKEIKRDT